MLKFLRGSLSRKKVFADEKRPSISETYCPPTLPPDSRLLPKDADSLDPSERTFSNTPSVLALDIANRGRKDAARIDSIYTSTSSRRPSAWGLPRVPEMTAADYKRVEEYLRLEKEEEEKKAGSEATSLPTRTVTSIGVETAVTPQDSLEGSERSCANQVALFDALGVLKLLPTGSFAVNSNEEHAVADIDQKEGEDIERKAVGTEEPVNAQIGNTEFKAVVVLYRSQGDEKEPKEVSRLDFCQIFIRPRTTGDGDEQKLLELVIRRLDNLAQKVII